jgi:hypothetical protein
MRFSLPTYIESVLREGEEVVYHTKLHWVVVMWPLLVVLIAFPVMSLSRNIGLAALGQLWMGFASIWVAASVINYLISELAVTNERIIGKVGFFRGELIDRDLAAIEEISVTQGAVGRALGYGSVAVRTRTQPELRIQRVLEPDRFRQMAVEQSPANGRDGQ